MSHLHKNKFHDLDIIRKNLTMEYRKKKVLIFNIEVGKVYLNKIKN